MREMRLKKREITDPEILREILESCEVVRIGAMDEEGMFIVPMNYGYDVREEDGTLHVCLYLHGAKEGRKAAAFAADPRVAVEMDYNHEVITGDYTCAYSYAYRSIMGNGIITEVTDPEAKKKGLEKIMAHIAPEAKIAFLPEMVERVLGHVRVDEHVMSPLREGDVARSPGMKYKHYAPKAKAVIFSGAPEHVVSAICRRYDEQTAKGERVAILGLDEHRYGDRTFISLGSEKRPQEAAARLFAALRELDERGDTVALCEAVDTAGIGLAVMNRMGRAAAFDIEQV